MKNVQEMRDQLAQAFEDLRMGKISCAEAEALANITGKIVTSTLAQLKMYELSGNPTDIQFLLEDPKHTPIEGKVTTKRITNKKGE